MCSPQAGSRYIAAASERQAQPQPRALMRSRCSPLFRRSQPDVGLRCRLARSSCRHCCGARRAKRSCGARRAKRTYRWSHGSPTEGCRGWSRLCGSRLPSCERDEQFSRRPDIDFGDGHFGAFACEQDGGGAAIPAPAPVMNAIFPASRGIDLSPGLRYSDHHWQSARREHMSFPVLRPTAIDELLGRRTNDMAPLWPRAGERQPAGRARRAGTCGARHGSEQRRRDPALF